MILVTGGTGLVGSHLLYQLTQESNNIRATYREKSSLEKVKKVFSYYSKEPSYFDKIEWIQADITKVPDMILAFKDVEYVYHCAAFISFDAKDYVEMRKVNIHGTAIIVNLSIDVKIKKLCFVSSIAAVGDNIKGGLIDEECEWNKESDNSGYSITKFGAEMEIWRASQEEIDVVIVNPGVILGPGFWKSGSGQLFTRVFEGFKFYTEGVTGFVDVNDVVQSMIQLMHSKKRNERYILVSENKSFKEIFFMISDALETKRPSIKIKPWQSSVFWRLAAFLSKITGKKPFLSKYSAKSSHSISKYSSKKITDSTKFEFLPIKESIEKTSKLFIQDLA